MLVLSLSACGNPAMPADSPFSESRIQDAALQSGTSAGRGAGDSALPSEQEPKTLRIAAGRTFWQGPATNIFLHGATNVWEALVMFDDDMEPAMHLAKSVTPSADGLTWTIELREGVKFHDGSDFTAEVAAYNLERLYRWNSASRAYDPDFARSGEFGVITGFDVISDFAFTVTHAAPLPDFDSRLSFDNSAMFAMASFGDDRVIQHPYGTGPFFFAEYDEPNQVLRLERFDQYRLGTPNIDTILFYNIPDASTRLAALQSGEIDVISDVGGLMPQQAAAVLADPNLMLRERQVSTIHYVAVNNNEGNVFSDVRMRNALSLSVDRGTIVDHLLLGYGVEAISVITDLSAGWTIDCGYRFDPAEAKAFVDAAMGGRIPEVVILVNTSLTGRWPYQDVAAILQSQLNDIGINARIETTDGATWNERMREKDYDITIHPFTVSAGEPLYFFIRNIASNGANNIMRGYGISDPVLDELIARAAVELNPSVRRQLYAEIQTIVRENDYIIPVWYDVTLYAMNNRVKDFILDVLFCPNLFIVDIA